MPHLIPWQHLWQKTGHNNHLMQTVFRVLISSLLFLAYPYLVYKGVQEGLVWFAPAVIASIYLYQAINAQKTQRRVQKLGVVVFLLLGTFFYQDVIAKLLPIFIQFSLMLFFGKTLLKDKGPSLIERFASIDFPYVPPVLSRYCRQLTFIWTGFFAFNVVACALLALFASVEWWAIYTGVLIFVLTAILMVAEYIWRFFLFRRIDIPVELIPDVKESAKNMIINSRKIWLDVHAS